MPPFPRNARRRVVARVLAVEQGKAGRARPRHAHEGRAGLRAEPGEHGLDLRHQRDRRRPRGRCALRASRRADRDRRRPSPRTPRQSTSATRGLTSSTGVPARSGMSIWRKAISRALASRRQASRHAGTSLPSVGRDCSACAGSICHNDVSRRSAAPASAEPPPMPEATGSRLSSGLRRPRSTPAAARSAWPAATTRLSSAAGKSAANWPETSSDNLVGRLGAQLVAVGAESEDRLDRVPPVGQLAANMERQVELGRRDLARGRSRRGVGGGQARRELALTRAATSSSAVTSAALQAKRASNRRPEVNKRVAKMLLDFGLVGVLLGRALQRRDGIGRPCRA